MITQIVNRCIIIRLLTASVLSLALTLAWLNPCPNAHAQEIPKSEAGTGTEGIWKTYRYVDGLASNWVWSIIQDKVGAIWFGTSNGVSRFDGKSWKTFTQKDGLADKKVNAIMQDKEGDIWFGTIGGINRFDGKNWKTYTKKDGLASNSVSGIVQDKEGTIWFGTFGGGVSRFDGRCFQTIDSRDELVNDVIRSLYIDRSGQIWMGTDNGVVQLTPNKIPPPVYITQVLADEKAYLRPRDRLTLSAGIRRVALDFHAISFKTRPGAMKYFYQLVGPVETTRRVVSTSWQGPTNNDTVEYFKLKPGKYSFKVQAVDRDLNYSEIASLQMVLPPLWYQKGWVRGMLLGGGLAFFAAFGLVTWRLLVHRIITRRLERKLREQQAREAQLQMLRYQLNPHFLFNAFNSIIALVSEDHHGAQKMMIQLSEYFRYSLLKPNSLEVALGNEIESVRNYLEIEKVRFEDRMEVAFDIEKLAEEYRLPVFLIQPLVENAIKYGMKTSPMPLKIRITAGVRDGSLHLEVSNTGKWVQQKTSEDVSEVGARRAVPYSEDKDNSVLLTGTGIGLKNVQERLNHAFPGRHRFEIFERDGWVQAVIEIDKL